MVVLIQVRCQLLYYLFNFSLSLSLSIETHKSFKNAHNNPSPPPPNLPSVGSDFASSLAPPHSRTSLQNFNSMAVGTTEEGCDGYSVVVLSDEGNTNTGLECEIPIDVLKPAEVRIPLKSQLSLDARLANQSYINMMVENAVAYIDVDIEKGKLETKSNEETLGDLKNEEALTKSLQKQISFDMGGKYMQLLMNHSLMLSKFSTRDKGATEKLLEGPRARKYKRAASFNSRKVVLLFSVLSSLGTIILIYLTLRVRQIGDASIHSE